MFLMKILNTRNEQLHHLDIGYKINLEDILQIRLKCIQTTLGMVSKALV